jgi:hypothetical protein
MTDDLFKAKILEILIRGALDDWIQNVRDRDLDEYNCCSGRDCLCGGQTVRDVWRDCLTD